MEWGGVTALPVSVLSIWVDRSVISCTEEAIGHPCLLGLYLRLHNMSRQASHCQPHQGAYPQHDSQATSSVQSRPPRQVHWTGPHKVLCA